MSLYKTNRTTSGMATVGARAKDAAAQAVPVGKRAGTAAVQGVRQGVQGAREWAGPRVEGAREWAAPRLEDAAVAVTTSVAPKVSSVLRSTARQVRPEAAKPGPAKSGIRRLIDWRWLLGIGAVAAAAGTTAAVAMRRRYASATAQAKEATESPDDEERDQDGEPAGEVPARSEGNGRVTTPGT